VTLLKSGKPLYNHVYDDDDGILDLELVPAHKASLNITKTSSNATSAASTNNTNSTISVNANKTKNASATAVSASDFTT
jgi:hypothetical protein